MGKIEIKAEVTGSVWKILVKPGDLVEEGDELMILESMKMEIPVLATENGTVAEILVQECDNGSGFTCVVNEGDVIALLGK